MGCLSTPISPPVAGVARLGRRPASGPVRRAGYLVLGFDQNVLRWKARHGSPNRWHCSPSALRFRQRRGLALWTESAAGLLDPRALWTYASRTIAVDMARTTGVRPNALRCTNSSNLPRL